MERLQVRNPAAWVIDTDSNLQTLLNTLSDIPASPSPLAPPCLYFDIEGKTYLVDIHPLGPSAFTTQGWKGHSLRNILEFTGIPKVFFDIRNDSDALFSLYGISVAGICDLQLMELAANRPSAKYVSGLAKCIDKDLPAMAAEKAEWTRCKEEVTRLYDPRKGGSYEVFNERPMRPQLKKYCAQDVEYLPKLWQAYATKVCTHGYAFWREMIWLETRDRIQKSQSTGYDGQGRQKALGPWAMELIDEKMEFWNEELVMEGVYAGLEMKELSFGVFRWE